MAIVRTVEWTLEAAWTTVLQASTDLVTALGTTAQVRRDYDISAASTLPACTVQCIGVVPLRSRGDGYYVAQIAVTAVTGMDTDTTGQSRANLAGAVRDVFEADALLTSLGTATGSGVTWSGVEQPEPSVVLDDANTHERELTQVFACTIKMP